MSSVLGIDPGQSGGLCLLPDDLTDIQIQVMPSPHELCALLVEWRPKHVFLEKAQAMPKQGVSSVFTYGHHNGVVEGILIALGIPHTLVPPSVWSAEIHKGTKIKKRKASEAGNASQLKNMRKQRSLEAATRLFPWLDFRGTAKSKKAHMGIVEAVLIAEYGRRSLK